MKKSLETTREMNNRDLAKVVTKVSLKILKYTFYAIVLYFAYEGFMAWE